MKKCGFCGAQLEDDAIFCSNCGRKIELYVCLHCGTELEEDSVFCSKCGMRLQTIPKEALPHETEIQEIDIPERSHSIWYVICCIGIVLLLLGGLYAHKYFNRISEKEISTTVANVNSNMELSLVGDADGFPLTLDLIIDNGNVTGTYKNVTYGTTMIVTGNMVDNVFNLNGDADNTNYTFHFVAEGENYTGSFGRVGEKKMNLYLKKNSVQENSKFILDNKINIFKAYKKSFDDIYYSQAIEKDKDGTLIGWIDYFLYDITRDGIPELWITYGSCEADHHLRVYTYNKENTYKILYKTIADHSSFFEGNGYIIKQWATMGEASWTKYTYNGKKIVETIIYEENVTEVDDEGCYYYRDYKTPPGKYIELNSFPNLEPLNRALGLE